MSDQHTADPDLATEAWQWYDHLVSIPVDGHSILKQLIERYESQTLRIAGLEHELKLYTNPPVRREDIT